MATAAPTTPLRIDGIDVHVEGRGSPGVLMIHGWPDTHRLWDGTVEALRGRHRCVRFTLPGYEIGTPRRAVSLAAMLELIEAIVDAVSPKRPVALLLHDW